MNPLNPQIRPWPVGRLPWRTGDADGSGWCGLREFLSVHTRGPGTAFATMRLLGFLRQARRGVVLLAVATTATVCACVLARSPLSAPGLVAALCCLIVLPAAWLCESFLLPYYIGVDVGTRADAWANALPYLFLPPVPYLFLRSSETYGMVAASGILAAVVSFNFARQYRLFRSPRIRGLLERTARMECRFAEADASHNAVVTRREAGPAAGKFLLNREMRNGFPLVQGPQQFQVTGDTEFQALRLHVGHEAAHGVAAGHLTITAGDDDLSVRRLGAELQSGWDAGEIRLSDPVDSVTVTVNNSLSASAYIDITPVNRAISHDPPRNIIVISYDGLVPAAFGLYRGEPSADCISRYFGAPGGMYFLNAFAPAEWTLPSLASLLAGLYPSEHGCIDHDLYSTSLPRDRPLLPELLKSIGFSTSAYSTAKRFTAGYGCHRGFDSFILDYNGYDSSDSLAHMTEHVINHLHDNRGCSNFILAHMFETHYPYYPIPSQLSRLTPSPNDIPYGSSPLPVEVLRRQYREAIERADRQFGVLVAYIEEHCADNTTVIVTSDHGVNLFDPVEAGRSFSEQSRYLLDSITRVPLFVRVPTATPPIRVEDYVESALATYATVLDSAGIANSTTLRHPSLLRPDEGGCYGKGYAISQSIYRERFELSVATPSFRYLVTTTRDRTTGELSRDEFVEEVEEAQPDLGHDSMVKIVEAALEAESMRELAPARLLADWRASWRA